MVAGVGLALLLSLVGSESRYAVKVSILATLMSQ